MIEDREELILSQNSNNETPILRKSHFLKTSNPRNQPVPKPPSSSSLISDYNLNLLQKKVLFKGRPKPHKNWQLWVGNLMQTHESTWKKAGIFDAIRATTYCLLRDNELILGLAGNWCSETNSFVFSWGECSITLEDVMILGGFSVLGECVRTPFENIEFEDVENELVSVFPVDRKNSRGRINQTQWMDYFIDFGGELEHMAFLVLWLSRYVFPTDYYCEISPFVFPIAIALARGTKIALAPAVLAAIYSDLSLLKDRIVSFVCPFDESNLVLWAPFQLVQLWAWERFPTLCLEPIALFEGEPRVARWQNLPMLKNKIVMMGFESLGESFLWRPYALCLENWRFPEFYSDEERLVLIDSEVGEELLSFARCLKVCELVGLDCTQQYLPHRVGKQFGLDQDIPSSVPRLNDSVELAWSSYNIPLDGAKLYLSHRLFQGGVTVQYSDWFKTEFFACCNSIPDFKRRRICSSSQREARFIPSKISDVVVVDNSNCTPACLASSRDVVVVNNSNCTPTCLALSRDVVLALCSDHSAERSSLRKSARAITPTISYVAVKDNSMGTPACLAPSHDMVVVDNSNNTPTCLAPSHDVVLVLSSDHSFERSSPRESTRSIPSTISYTAVKDNSKCTPTCLAPSRDVVLALCSVQSMESSPRELSRFIPSTTSDAAEENDSLSTPTCLAPSSNNFLALCSVRSVGNMQVEATPSCDKKSLVHDYEEMPSPTPNNELAIVASHDLDGLTTPNCNRTSSCVNSSCCGSVPSSSVLNTEEQHIEAAPCDPRATPSRSYAENSECLPSQCPTEVKTTLSKNFDQTTDLNNLPSVGEMPDETTTICDDADKRLRTPPPSHNLAADSDHCSSQSLIKEKNNPSRTLNEIEEDNSKSALPCLPSSLNAVEGSRFVDYVGEICIETIPSSDDNNHENVPCSSTEIDIEKIVGGLDLVMEEVGAYRTRCMNMRCDRSVDFVAVNTDTLPSCNDKGVNPRESHDIVVNEVSLKESNDIVNEVGPSLCKQKANNGAPSSVNIVTEGTDEHEKNHEDTSCTKTEIANDVKLLASSYDNPVIIYDDNEDDMENDGLIPFEAMCSGFERRISRLERVVSRIQAAKLLTIQC